MLILYETPAGYALFKSAKGSKIQDPNYALENLSTLEDTRSNLSLSSFCKFENTTKALESISSLVEGKMSKDLKKFLKKNIGKDSKLAVSDPKLAASIAKKLGIDVVADGVGEVFRCIREHVDGLLGDINAEDLHSMALGLSHSLSRFKLRFSSDKVDTMIIQAVSLLDDLDKELNTYCMRLKEWYGWHFPELARIIVDHVAFARLILLVGFRTEVANADLDSILPEDLAASVRAAAEISMGTEISEQDLFNIRALATQVIGISEYRTELYEYLKNRMMAIAPNLTMMVGELVGARLISRAGSLMNLAKCPASTVQILGAEKALFRALKTKHDTPKYGLIYHASLVGQAAPKLKGKISRVLAAKTSLCVRADALCEDDQVPEIGAKNRLFVEERLRQLEASVKGGFAGPVKAKAPQQKYNYNAASASSNGSYNTQSDYTEQPKAKKSRK